MHRIILSLILLTTSLLYALAPQSASAQTTQCVSSAVAGGTANALTVPELPCGVTTTILILTVTTSNTSTSPTLQMVGATALPIVNSDGSSVWAGRLAAGAQYMLTNTGSQWRIITSGPFQQVNNTSFPSVADFGAVCDWNGTTGTDDTTALNAAYSWSATNHQPVRQLPNCYSATGITIPPSGILWGQITPANPPTGSSIVCPSSVTVCVTAGGSTLGTTITGVLIQGGSSNLGTGIKITNAYNVLLNNVMVKNFADCYYVYNDGTGSGGLSVQGSGIYSGACSSHHFVVDSWPEVKITHGRFGMNGGGDATGTDSYFYFTGGYPATAAAPNSVQCIECQFNTGAASSAPNYWLHFADIPNGADVGAISMIGDILDSTAGGMSSLIRLDNDVLQFVKGLTISNSYFNATASSLFSYASTQPTIAWNFNNNTFYLTSGWSFPSVQHQRFNFNHNYVNADGGNFTITGGNNSDMDFSGNNYDGGSNPLLTGGAWTAFTQFGGYMIITNSGATGSIIMLPGSQTPTLSNLIVGGAITHVGGAFHLSGTTPAATFDDTSAAANNKMWDIFLNGGSFIIRADNDAYNAALEALTINRSGIASASVSVRAGGTISEAVNLDGTQTISNKSLSCVAYASLPGTPTTGAIGCITDGSTNVWGAAVIGGGANNVEVRYNGANWTVVGK